MSNSAAGPTHVNAHLALLIPQEREYFRAHGYDAIKSYVDVILPAVGAGDDDIPIAYDKRISAIVGGKLRHRELAVIAIVHDVELAGHVLFPLQNAADIFRGVLRARLCAPAARQSSNVRRTFLRRIVPVTSRRAPRATNSALWLG